MFGPASGAVWPHLLGWTRELDRRLDDLKVSNRQREAKSRMERAIERDGTASWRRLMRRLDGFLPHDGDRPLLSLRRREESNAREPAEPG